MDIPKGKLVVFYDGSCPSCIKDRERYEKLAGKTGESVEWLDITGREDRLREEGIDPEKALRELHVKDSRGQIHREMDAYILLMSRVTVLKPLAWLIGLPVIRPLLARIYHYLVDRRLAKSG
ncbi:MAG: DUF393 domain-containing protein [Marinobacter sp.]|jgi:predicted DCC family thiol-disulfide oxidoreductase YuxK|nr:DUF393 domain-containing protein [Marinobacter sp.]